VEVRIILRRLLTTLAVVPLIATVGLLGSASPAGAAEHPITGTYQLFLQGSSAQTLVLLPHHAVGTPFNNGTWSVRKREVTIDVSGGQAPIIACLESGQAPTCYFNDQFVGLKTPTGIASQAAPGVANAYVGSNLVDSEPFWAVRTGRA
jgi:hypothetical protein